MVKFFSWWKRDKNSRATGMKGRKKRSESRDKPIDQAMLDIEAKLIAQGGAVIDLTGQGVKEKSAEDIERQRRAREFEKIGDACYASDKCLQAIEAYQKALEIYPDEVLYQNIGSCYYAMGQFEKGISYLEKAIEINPNSEKARKNLEKVKAYLKSQR